MKVNKKILQPSIWYHISRPFEIEKLVDNQGEKIAKNKATIITNTSNKSKNFVVVLANALAKPYFFFSFLFKSLTTNQYPN